jgi:hypothetical protein
VAGDHRARRLTDSPSTEQHTLEPTPEVPSSPLEPSPPELLEPPSPQHAAALLEDRQKRWFELRERALKTRDTQADSTSGTAAGSASDPKA